jgi:hypothetical protein
MKREENGCPASEFSIQDCYVWKIGVLRVEIGVSELI